MKSGNRSHSRSTQQGGDNPPPTRPPAPERAMFVCDGSFNHPPPPHDESLLNGNKKMDGGERDSGRLRSYPPTPPPAGCMHVEFVRLESEWVKRPSCRTYQSTLLDTIMEISYSLEEKTLYTCLQPFLRYVIHTYTHIHGAE